MQEYILGFPQGSPQTKENLVLWTDMQDATLNCSYTCAVFHNSLEEAKTKFMTVFKASNASITDPGKITSVNEYLPAFNLLKELYDRMCTAYEQHGTNTTLGALPNLYWDADTSFQQQVESALRLPHKKLNRVK